MSNTSRPGGARLPIEMIRSMRLAGRSWLSISAAVGAGVEAIRRAVDPEWAAKRREGQNANRKRLRISRDLPSPKQQRPDTNRPTLDEARRAIAGVPRDTRDLTSRLLGDPLPGRSALDRKEPRP